MLMFSDSQQPQEGIIIIKYLSNLVYYDIFETKLSVIKLLLGTETLRHINIYRNIKKYRNSRYGGE